jgi:meso-butanediol dehydrogenase/(S,S)-butanediol dehydrogenase/diacetyl reductase
MGRVQDRVVIVTGGAGGIGAATCQAVAAEGAKVVVADLDASAAQAVADVIVANGGTAVSVGVDVTDRVQVQAMVQKAVDSFGALNVIFNNAGMNRPRNFMDVDEENFESIVRVNAWGVVVCTQEAAKQMIKQGSGGKIINTGSIAGRQGFWDFVPYCVAKFGVLAITQATARGLIEHGITVNAFAPGVVDTPMWVGLNEDIREIHDQPANSDPMREFATGTLIGRPAAPGELTPFLVYLASPESDYMTGQMYMVDGGQVLV